MIAREQDEEPSYACMGESGLGVDFWSASRYIEQRVWRGGGADTKASELLRQS